MMGSNSLQSPEKVDWLWDSFNAAAMPESSVNISAVEIAEETRARLNKAYTRCFSSSEGQLVLEHLKQITLSRALGPDSSADALRQLEGQRQLVLQINAFVEKGQLG